MNSHATFSSALACTQSYRPLNPLSLRVLSVARRIRCSPKLSCVRWVCRFRHGRTHCRDTSRRDLRRTRPSLRLVFPDANGLQAIRLQGRPLNAIFPCAASISMRSIHYRAVSALFSIAATAARALDPRPERGDRLDVVAQFSSELFFRLLLPPLRLLPSPKNLLPFRDSP